jgi:sterol desaturase/sphingolipid hydroxylase (fatty acid hydroxylase superfamily)
MHYLRDFAEAFMILFGAYIQFLSASVAVSGFILAALWASIPHLARRI